MWCVITCLSVKILWFNGVCMIERRSARVICDTWSKTIKINVINISVPSVESVVVNWAWTQHGSSNQYSRFHEYLGLFQEILSFLTSDYLSEINSQKLHTRILNKDIWACLWILRDLKYYIPAEIKVGMKQVVPHSLVNVSRKV